MEIIRLASYATLREKSKTRIPGTCYKMSLEVSKEDDVYQERVENSILPPSCGGKQRAIEVSYAVLKTFGVSLNSIHWLQVIEESISN